MTRATLTRDRRDPCCEKAIVKAWVTTPSAQWKKAGFFNLTLPYSTIFSTIVLYIPNGLQNLLRQKDHPFQTGGAIYSL